MMERVRDIDGEGEGEGEGEGNLGTRSEGWREGEAEKRAREMGECTCSSPSLCCSVLQSPELCCSLACCAVVSRAVL